MFFESLKELFEAIANLQKSYKLNVKIFFPKKYMRAVYMILHCHQIC